MSEFAHHINNASYTVMLHMLAWCLLLVAYKAGMQLHAQLATPTNTQLKETHLVE